MGHEDDGLPLLVETLEKGQYGEGCSGVEVSGCLVGKQDDGIVDQCTGYRHTLLLTSRHLIALVIQSLAQSHFAETTLRTLRTFLRADR